MPLLWLILGRQGRLRAHYLQGLRHQTVHGQWAGTWYVFLLLLWPAPRMVWG